MPQLFAFILVIIVGSAGIMPLRLVAAAANPSAPAPSAVVAPQPDAQVHAIANIELRRLGEAPGAAQVVITLANPDTPVEVRKEANRTVVEFKGADLPLQLQRRFDVVDAGTLVTDLDAMRSGNGAQVVISTTGDVAQRSRRTNGQFIVELQAADQPRAAPAAGNTYTGARMSATYENIPTRTLLKLIAETGGKNMVIHDGVGGNVTLRATDMPWDLLLDTVLQTKGLVKTMRGDVIVISPARLPSAPPQSAPVEASANSFDITGRLSLGPSQSPRRVVGARLVIADGQPGEILVDQELRVVITPQARKDNPPAGDVMIGLQLLGFRDGRYELIASPSLLATRGGEVSMATQLPNGEHVELKLTLAGAAKPVQ